MAEQDTRGPSGAGGVYEEGGRGAAAAAEAARHWDFAKQQELCPRVAVD
jgi:hypothetical protein